jgi:flagellar biosynthesis GTPase FlhF
MPEPRIAAPVPVPAPASPVPAVVARTPAPSGELPAEALELCERGLSEAFAAAVADEAITHLMPFARDPALKPVLREALAARIPIARPKVGTSGGVIGFVGPGGSGKTRCVARLASAYAQRSPLPVACVTLRSKDGGAELSRLLASAGVPIHVEDDPALAAQRVQELRGHSLVLLDTPGVSPRAEAELRQLAAELHQLAADELHLTVPATIAPAAARELVDGARTLGVDAIALTHADETEQLGTVVELAVDTGLPLSFVGRGTSLDAGLRPAVAEELALAVLP